MENFLGIFGILVSHILGVVIMMRLTSSMKVYYYVDYFVATHHLFLEFIHFKFHRIRYMNDKMDLMSSNITKMERKAQKGRKFDKN